MSHEKTLSIISVRGKRAATNLNLTDLDQILVVQVSKIYQRNENAALKTFYVTNPSFIVTLYCRTLQ